jgi:arabinose-5-phosphate isomerase
MINKIQSLIDKEIDAIKQIPIDDTAFEDALGLIQFFVHTLGGKVITSGMGKAGHIAHNIAMTLSSTGTPAVFIHPAEAQHGDLGIIGKNDILLVISNSGKTREILEFIQLTKNIYNLMQVICITSCADCELAEKSDVVLLTGSGKEIDKFELVPTTSTTLMTIIGDVLVVELMDRINFTREHYNMLHHSGYIGKQLKNVKD